MPKSGWLVREYEQVRFCRESRCFGSLFGWVLERERILTFAIFSVPHLGTTPKSQLTREKLKMYSSIERHWIEQLWNHDPNFLTEQFNRAGFSTKSWNIITGCYPNPSFIVPEGVDLNHFHGEILLEIDLQFRVSSRVSCSIPRDNTKEAYAPPFLEETVVKHPVVRALSP